MSIDVSSVKCHLVSFVSVRSLINDYQCNRKESNHNLSVQNVIDQTDFYQASSNSTSPHHSTTPWAWMSAPRKSSLSSLKQRKIQFRVFSFFPSARVIVLLALNENSTNRMLFRGFRVFRCCSFSMARLVIFINLFGRWRSAEFVRPAHPRDISHRYAINSTVQAEAGGLVRATRVRGGDGEDNDNLFID